MAAVYSPRVCMLLTSVTMMPNGKETGFFLEELCTPYYIFKDAGWRIQLASVLGGAAPPDPKSRDKSVASDMVDKFLTDQNAMWEVQATKRIADLIPADYDAVFLVGGHGCLWDFELPAVSHFVEGIFAANKLIGAICHGGVALLSAKKPNGMPLVQGIHLTAFSNKEEKAMGTEKQVPFLLETRLCEQGALFEEPAKSMAEKVVVDGQLLTGANPASSKSLALAIVQRLTMAA